MFYTRSEGELPLPKGLAPEGERSWWWIEFGLAIPYLLISLQVTTEEGQFVRNLLTSRIEDLLHIATKEDLSVQIRNVQVLSPHYMNGTDHYQLHVVRQIWRGKNGMPDLVFVMEDGSRQSYVLSDEESAVDDLVLAYDGSSISH